MSQLGRLGPGISRCDRSRRAPSVARALQGVSAGPPRSPSCSPRWPVWPVPRYLGRSPGGGPAPMLLAWGGAPPLHWARASPAWVEPILALSSRDGVAEGLLLVRVGRSPPPSRGLHTISRCAGRSFPEELPFVVTLYSSIARPPPPGRPSARLHPPRRGVGCWVAGMAWASPPPHCVGGSAAQLELKLGTGQYVRGVALGAREPIGWPTPHSGADRSPRPRCNYCCCCCG